MELVKRYSLFTVYEDGQQIASYSSDRKRQATAMGRMRAKRHGSFVLVYENDYEIWRGQNMLRSRVQKDAGRRVVGAWDGRRGSSRKYVARKAS